MPANDNGSGAAVVEIAPPTDLAKALTLFQIEESLVLLAESAEEEGLTPEIEQALTVYLHAQNRLAGRPGSYPQLRRRRGKESRGAARAG